MTYCLSLLCREGIVFLSDTRTSAGAENLKVHSKMRIYDRPGDRLVCLLSAGNLSVTQTVCSFVEEDLAAGEHDSGHENLLNQHSLFTSARYVGNVIRRVAALDRAALLADGIGFDCNIILGGQIAGQRPGLFHIYPQGNSIHASPSAPFLQIGEAKYGKPILDRGFTHETGLAEGVKYGLISMDATLKSNVSVGTPVEVLCYRTDTLTAGKHVWIEDSDPYFSDLRDRWHKGVISLVQEIPVPRWAG